MFKFGPLPHHRTTHCRGPSSETATDDAHATQTRARARISHAARCTLHHAAAAGREGGDKERAVGSLTTPRRRSAGSGTICGRWSWSTRGSRR